MAVFELKENLPLSTRIEIDRIMAIDSGLRMTTESAFLTALDPYLYNRVLRWDTTLVLSPQNTLAHKDGDNILEAEGYTLPTDKSGFKVGAMFYLLGVYGRTPYWNVGTITSARWQI